MVGCLVREVDSTIGEDIVLFFSGFGAPGLAIALYLIIVLDAALFPALPEFFSVMIFIANPLGLHPLWWGALVVVIALLGEATGLSLLYLACKRVRLPGFMKRVMKRYIGMLLVKDEKVILVNRLIPVVPLLGAFIATCGWDFRRSMFYNEGAALAKYSVLLAIVGAFSISYPRDVVSTFALVAVVIFVGASFLVSYLLKRRMKPAKTEGAPQAGRP